MGDTISKWHEMQEEMSDREITDYLKILDTQEINRILTDRGLNKKEIKPLLK